MALLKKYDLKGKELGEIAVEDKLLEVKANEHMIKDYLVAIRKNARQWSANTKGRSEVKCSNIKPHKQKGTGRARQGTLAAPHYKGGGIVFGPKPKFNQHTRINKKERQAVINHLIADKIKKNQTHIIDSEKMKEPKTKIIDALIKKLPVKSKRVLFLTKVGDDNQNFIKSIKNIQKTQYVYLSNLNGYNLALCDEIIVSEKAFEEVLTLLTKGSK